jgi:ankyrin repeat protein
MYYLLSWEASQSYVNTQDDSGKTALHIAIKFSEKFTDLRPIKELLMKGADRKIRDKKGDRPIEYVEKYVTSPETQRDLRLLLANPRVYCTGVLALCCVRQPLRK